MKKAFAILFYVIAIYFTIRGLFGVLGFGFTFLGTIPSDILRMNGIVDLIIALSAFLAGYGLRSGKKAITIIGIVVLVLLTFKIPLTMLWLKAF